MGNYIQKLAELRRNARSANKEVMKSVVQEILQEQRREKQSRHQGRQTEFDVGDAIFKGMGPRRFLKMMHKTAPQDDLQLEFQKAADTVYITKQVLAAQGKRLRKNSKVFLNLQKLGFMLQKGLGAGSTGSGEEFVPTDLSRSLLDLVRLETKVVALHPRITMPTNPFEIPLEGADVDVLLVAEQTSDNTTTEANKIGAATPSTSKVTLTAVKLALRTVWSEEVDQDSIISINDYVRRKLAQAMANGQEEAVLSGDTAGTHQDSDVTAATDRRKAWDGYRKLALAAAKVDNGNAPASLTNLRSVKRGMGKFGVNPSDLAWVVGISGWNDLLDIPEVQTLDKFGPEAVILSGQLGALDGIPIIVSEFVREDLNASGVEDGATTDRSVIHLAHTDSFLFGDRLNVTMKSMEMIETDQIVMVIKQRLAFEPSQDATAETIVGTLFNLST